MDLKTALTFIRLFFWRLEAAVRLKLIHAVPAFGWLESWDYAAVLTTYLEDDSVLEDFEGRWPTPAEVIEIDREYWGE